MEQTLIRTIWMIYLQAEGMSGLLLVLVCGTLYAHRRRAYFLYWTLAWLMFGAWRLLNGVTLGEPGLSTLRPEYRGIVLDLAAVCGWWHLCFWLFGLIHVRRIHQVGSPTAVPGPPLFVVLPGLVAAVVPAILVRHFVPDLASAVLSVIVAAVYGGSAAWFAARWWQSGQLGILLLPVSLGLCAAARLYATKLDLHPPMGGSVFTILYQNALIDVLSQTLTVVAAIVVLLNDESTLLRETGQRLAESEDRFRLLFDYGGVGMALLSPEGEFLQVNPALVQMLHYTPSELIGKHVLDVMYGEDRSSSNRLRTQEKSPQYEREKRFVRRDGQLVWARMVRVPIPDAQNSVRYHAVVFVDVTERKHAERALREERDFISQILQIADALILVLDAEGRILRFNAKCQTVSGRSEKEVCGRFLWECLPPPRAVDSVRQTFRQLLQSNGTASARLFDMPWRASNGEERLIAWRHSVVHDEIHRPRHIICVGLDVTEQRRLEEQLGRARKMEMLVTLVGGIAHDFNNQLTAILGNLDMLRMDLDHLPSDAMERMQPCLDGADRAAQRCARMTGRLLTFSRGRLGILQTVALDRLVAESSAALRHQLPNIQLDLIAPPGLPPVTVDVAQIHELLHNLVANAREAMPDGGTLTLSLASRAFTSADCDDNLDARPGAFVELCVRDTGCGMPPEIRERIFEPFFTTKKPPQGRGMGLAVVFGIVKGHKGWIAVESEVGVGTAVHVYLPAARVPASPAAPPAAPPPLAAQGQRILVVDDEPLVRDLAANILERTGYGVVLAEDGEEALNVYRREADKIDLVLLDYIMPRMNGAQVLKELRQLDPNVRVLLSSGYHTDHEVDQLLASGAQAFVAKPYRAQELVQSVQKALAARSAV
jgi:two-component system cell cycle sensor histidine kinase/response regulator CckA